MVLPTSLKDWAEMVETVLKALGILAAGGWAYFHYFRGRTYKARLRIKVEGEGLYKGPALYLLVSVEIENKGLSKVPIDQTGTGLRVLAHGDWADPQNMKHLETLSIFEEHEWIEPGEIVIDEKIVHLPNSDLLAIRLELHLVSGDSSWTTLSTIPVNLEKRNARRQTRSGEVRCDEPSEEGQRKGQADRERKEEDEREEGQ